jgi:hypothetical protein
MCKWGVHSDQCRVNTVQAGYRKGYMRHKYTTAGTVS